MARDLALERAWRDRVRRHQKSRLTIQAFCQQEGLVAHQFSWWRRELRQRDAESSKGKTPRKAKKKRPKRAGRSFVPVEVAQVNTPAASIEIVLDKPPRIAVSPGFDPQLLSQVLRVMENGSC